MHVESAASEHGQGDEVVDVVEAVGHADGDLDPVVGCFESGVGVARPDGPEDVGASASDLFGEFDDLGYAAARGPEHPVVEFAARLVEGVSEQGAQEFLELPGAVEPALRVRVPDGAERVVLPVGRVVRVLQDGVLDAAHALGHLLVAGASRLVPQASADLVERAGHPGDDVEPVEHAFGVRAVRGDA